MQKFSFVLSIPLLLAACGHTPAPKADEATKVAPKPIVKEVPRAEVKEVPEVKEVMKSEDTMEAKDAPEATEKSEGRYLAYTDGVIGNGEPSVLFFKASWCPSCIANDKKLTSWYPSGDYVNTYVLDYDSSSELKSQFGVVQQDTFVRIDGEGNVVDLVSFPSESGLQSLIKRT